MESKVIAISNMKGGVGKTTLTINLAHQVANYTDVCIVDIDPRVHSIKFFLSEKDIYEHKVQLKNVLEKIMEIGHFSLEIEDILKTLLSESIISIEKPNFKHYIDFIVSSPLIDSIDDKIKSEIAVPYLFKKLFELLKEKYKIILVDCPPSISIAMVQSVYCGCDYILIPTDPNYFSVESIDNIMNVYIKVKAHYNDNLSILGIILTMFKKNHQLAKLFKKKLSKYYPEYFINEVQIPALIDFQKSISAKQDVCSFNEKSRACKSIKKLTETILKKLKIVHF